MVTQKIKDQLRRIPAIRNLLPWEGVGRFKANLSEVHERVGHSDLERLFLAHDGPRLNKWLHYLPIYDRYLSPWRGRALRMLEIGVFGGGSLKLWRDYFGPDAVLFGADINPQCAAHDGAHGQVRIGDQSDPAFLRGVVEEMGGVDIVLDDGSHVMEHLSASFDTLFPLLTTGGLYIAEDLHTAYWPSYGGGLRHRDSFIERAKDTVDDMHHWYHREGVRNPDIGDAVGALHFHDSMVVIEKAGPQRPVHVVVGN
ncbi:MAG: class I SAM-dependent methyltransferase [Alteraurantiacibacter sp.]